MNLYGFSQTGKEPSIDPCGTLYDMPEISEKELSKFTVHLCFDR